MADRVLFFGQQEDELLTDLSNRQGARVAALVEGDKKVRFRIYSDDPDYADGTTTVRLGLTIPDMKSNAASGGVFQLSNRDTATFNNAALVVGDWYEIVFYQAGDDFSNVGGGNATGTIFQATGTTPADWSHNSAVCRVTAPISATATPTEIQSAVNAAKLGKENLPVTFTVTKDDKSGLLLFRGSQKREYTPAVITDGLYPDSSAVVDVLQAGNEVETDVLFTLWLKPDPPAITTSATAITVPDPSEMIDNVHLGVQDEEAAIWSLVIGPCCYRGTYFLSFDEEQTGPLSFNATADEIRSALEELSGIGEGNVTVTQLEAGPEWFRYEIVLDKSLPPEDLEISAETLVFGAGKSYELDLDSTNMRWAMQGRSNRNLTLELELTKGGRVWTAFQEVVRINAEGLR
jgi:hypothetical protein